MLVGLTGGIGSGKSSAGAILAECGALWIDCDRIVAELLDNDAGVRAALLKRFGPKVFARKGRVDRTFLSGIVFENAPQRVWLENLLHPIVRRDWENQAAKDTGSIAIVEIPLLFEKKLEKNFQLTVCISASLSTQLRRGRAKGLARSQILARISLQLPLSEKVKRADFVVSNDGSPKFLRNQILLLHQQIYSS